MAASPPRHDLSAPLESLHSNERVKHDSRQLRGTLRDSLADAVTGAVDETDTLLTKFFGIYQQDDRDLREERRRARLEPRYQFMVRVRLPGGVCRPDQWLKLDEMARSHADGTLRLTTRQTFQFHGIRKRHLRLHMQGLRSVGLDTIAACGDDNRNVICTANPLFSSAHAEVSRLAAQISARLLPRTGAYREVFLDESPAAAAADGAEEPLYGTTYLPRKFKIALAVPPSNDIDVYAHDLGFVAVVDNGRLAGFNVLAGGGMGMTHNAPHTFPRLSEPVGFCSTGDAAAIAEHAMCIQRDHGNRKDRAHARFKYTIEDRGIPWFRAELERRLGRALEASRTIHFTHSTDLPGWSQGADGRWHFTIVVPNGRLADRPGRPHLTGMRAIASEHKGLLALTTNQNVIIAGVAEVDRGRVQALLEEHALVQPTRTRVRDAAMACVAFPTCGLAMAESERYLPTLLDAVDAMLEELALDDQPITLRVSGCPNGCSRPFLAEIALVGKAPGRYNLYLGAGPAGERLNALYRETLDEARILVELRQLLGRYASERRPGEAFGEFVVRAGIVPAMHSGRDFQKRAPASAA
jgi:sulfite reductase (NADPH) hemoprotein beta-component